MELITRRRFGLITMGGVAVLALGTEEGCNLSSALTEADNIIMLIAPLGDGAAVIVEIADPPLAPAVMAAVKIYDLGVAAVEKYLADWAKAAGSAQPGILSQAQAAVLALKNDVASLIAAAQVKSASAAAEIEVIFGTIVNEISALLTVIPQIGALGGTTQAMNAYSKTVASGRAKNLYGVRSAKTHRNDLVKRFSRPTGTAIDPARTALGAKLSALQMK